jgi:hypothetical protein
MNTVTEKWNGNYSPLTVEVNFMTMESKLLFSFLGIFNSEHIYTMVE